MVSYHSESAQRYNETMENLKIINETIAYLLQVAHLTVCLLLLLLFFFTSFSNSYSKFQFNIKDSMCYKKSLLHQCLISNVCFIGNQSSAGKNWWQVWLADTTPRRDWREFIDRYHMSNACWVFPVSHTLYIVPKRSYFLEAGSSNSGSSERLEWN